jgi:hypothetical protein
MKRIMVSVVMALLAAATSGCATIVAKSSQEITVTSAPPGAAVTVTNRAGLVVHSGNTPLTVTLRKGAGYFKPASYTLRFTKDGFEPSEMHLKGTVSGWYFGNIVFGGLIGMVAVDPATGAMYKLRPDTVEAALQAVKITQIEPGSMTVVSAEDLPAEILAQSTKIATN